ncbi:MAG: response regulator [Chloroflexota bacterium]|nr:response regulator [Chloroflexota bacterium]MDE2841205.1 response regulator [Chloroflexota bacterium]
MSATTPDMATFEQPTPQARILVVDDESIIRLDLRERLNELRYSVVGEAADGHMAVALTRRLDPDLVLMDIKMPKMDGITAARVLQEERIAPIVLLTAFSDRELIEDAREAGVLGYISKPFREADLVPTLEVAIARFAELKAIELENADLKEALETRRLVDRAKGMLMDSQGLTEAAAFRRIQKLAMDRRKPIKEIAEAIILANEIT